MRSVVFGYHTMGCLGLEALVRHGFDVPLVITHDDDPGEEIWWRSLADLANGIGIPVHRPADAAAPAVRQLVEEARPDLIFSFYYRQLLPQALLDLAPRGRFNLHGSLLPRLRGRAPVNWALVLGERETGVSLHEMVARPDAGGIVDQEAVEIADLDTAYTLYGKLESAATRLLDRALPRLLAGDSTTTPQNLEAGSYHGRRRPEDGRIDWSWRADRIYGLIRAVTHPYPGAFTTKAGSRLLVWWGLPEEGNGGEAPGTVIGIDRDGVRVAAGTGSLRLVTLQLEGTPEQPAASLAASLGLGVGDHLGNERNDR